MISSDKNLQAISACVASSLSGGRVLIVATNKIKARVIWIDIQTVCELTGLNIKHVAKNLKISWSK